MCTIFIGPVDWGKRMQDKCAGWGFGAPWGNRMLWPLFTSSPLLHLPPPGRTSFYEEYGVIRDVLQNHLTEVLTLVAMELPLNVSSAEAVLRHKLQVFQALRGLQRGSAVVGQYQSYSEQVRRELQKPDSFHSLTPTFAGGPWGRAWGTGLPTSPGAAFQSRCPWVGWRGLEVGFPPGCSEARMAFPCLPGLLPA